MVRRAALMLSIYSTYAIALGYASPMLYSISHV